MNNNTAEKNTLFDYLTKIETENALKTFEASKTLADEIKVRTILDQEGLNFECRKGWLKMRVINDNEFCIFKNPNPRGNPLCACGLNKNGAETIVSNSENARFQARNRLIEIIKANSDFNYFFTGTFDPRKWNRKNFRELLKSLTRWLRRRKIKYILIPEPHKDGSIHFHGFFNASIEPFLEKFDLKQKLPKRITDGIKDGREIYNCPAYADMFGWVSIEKVRNLEASAVYVSKYVSKSFDNDEARFSYHRYFCSIGLKRPYDDIPTEKKIDGFIPVRYSSKIVKVTYKNFDQEPLGVRQEPEGGAKTLSVCQKSPFLGAVREAHT